jgi:hypothetical protein
VTEINCRGFGTTASYSPNENRSLIETLEFHIAIGLPLQELPGWHCQKETQGIPDCRATNFARLFCYYKAQFFGRFTMKVIKRVLVRTQRPFLATKSGSNIL